MTKSRTFFCIPPHRGWETSKRLPGLLRIGPENSLSKPIGSMSLSLPGSGETHFAEGIWDSRVIDNCQHVSGLRMVMESLRTQWYLIGRGTPSPIDLTSEENRMCATASFPQSEACRRNYLWLQLNFLPRKFLSLSTFCLLVGWFVCFGLCLTFIGS